MKKGNKKLTKPNPKNKNTVVPELHTLKPDGVENNILDANTLLKDLTNDKMILSEL